MSETQIHALATLLPERSRGADGEHLQVLARVGPRPDGATTTPVATSMGLTHEEASLRSPPFSSVRPRSPCNLWIRST
jgi:hypothetical protein